MVEKIVVLDGIVISPGALSSAVLEAYRRSWELMIAV
jgi:hypothetical protein